MSGLSLHLAPNAPWLILAALSLAFIGLALWAYSFRLPPLAPGVRRLLTGLRIAVLVALVWLLALPVLERSRPSSGARVVILEDVTTTGGSALKAVEALQAEGAVIVRVLTLVDRKEGAADTFAICIRDSTPSCIRAPPDALITTAGTWRAAARSNSRVIISPTTEPIEPPR